MASICRRDVSALDVGILQFFTPQLARVTSVKMIALAASASTGSRCPLSALSSLRCAVLKPFAGVPRIEPRKPMLAGLGEEVRLSARHHYSSAGHRHLGLESHMRPSSY